MLVVFWAIGPLLIFIPAGTLKGWMWSGFSMKSMLIQMYHVWTTILRLDKL